MKKRNIKKTRNPVVRLKPPLELHERYKNISRQEGFGTVSAWITATINKRLEDAEANQKVNPVAESN